MSLSSSVLRALGMLFSVPRGFWVKEILYGLLGTHILSAFGSFWDMLNSCVSEHRPPCVD